MLISFSTLSGSRCSTLGASSLVSSIEIWRVPRILPDELHANELGPKGSVQPHRLIKVEAGLGLRTE